MSLLALLALVTLARADGSPDIQGSVSSSATLYGDPVHVTLSAENPQGQPYGYNLSFRVVLPEGVGYEGGGPVAPKEIADAPGPGETTLIFENVSDLSPGATKTFAFDLEYDDSIYDAGDSFPVRGQAFVNDDPRYIPKFNAEGLPQNEETSYTGSTPELTGIQTLKAIEVEIEEPSPEGEILRGVHEHQTVYTLKVTNNGINPTTGTKLDAYIPAGLEFLGCGGPGADNTTDAPTNPGSAEEWPGSGAIEVAPLGGCVAPESVETELVDPDGPGPLPEAIYTHVVFPVGELKDGETKAFPYRAAVPLRANTNTFTGTRPSAASGDQATNLDNNGGAEVVDETLLRAYAKASGTYQGKTPGPASDSEVLDRAAEDWVVHKSASSGTLAQGQVTTWTLTFETSEYKFVDGATVTDTLPDGLCPLGPENFTSGNDPADSECDPTGQEPSAPYASAEENEDGTWTLTWDEASLAKLGHTGISDVFTITFPSKTRTHYQEDEDPTTAVLAHDRVDNTVTTEGSGMARCAAPGTPDCSTPGPKIYGNDGPTIVDASHAEQEAGAPVIDKKIAASGAECEGATYTEEAPHYRPGDIVCWKLRVDFPGALDTTPQALADFLPEGTEYIAGSDTPTADNDVTATIDESAAAEGLLTWTVTGSTVPAGGEVFEHTIRTRVKPVGSPANGDLVGNLFKFSSENTGEESFPQRDEAEFVLDTPELSLVKGVNGVNAQPPGGNPPNTDGVEVHEGDFVEYEIEVTNNGDAPAWNVEVSDLLEDGITCEDVSVVSHAGGCSIPAKRVDWFFEGPIAPGATETFLYAVEIPSGVNPGKRIDDHAGVVSYQSETNAQPTPEFFTYVPASNINPSAPTPNAPAADDTSWVHTPGVSFAKTAVTGVSETGNNAATQATIGELITYTAKFIQPAGTTINSAEYSDHLEAGRYEFVSADVTLNGGPLPGASSVALDPSGGIEASIAGPLTNPTGSGDDVFELTMIARVADVAANSRVAPKQTLTNTAHFDWTDEAGGEHPETASVSTEIVEPNITASKTDDEADNRVDPGQVVEYTVGATNATGTRVSTGHDVVIADKVPVGLIPVGPAPGNEPLADEAEVPGSGGAIWDADTRAITKKVGTFAPGAGSSFSYRAEVEAPAVAGSSLTNEVKNTVASLGEGTPNRRASGSGYEATAKDTLTIGGASIEKTVSPEKATIGEDVTYELTVTIPANVELFDTTVFDELPWNLEFKDVVSEECVSGCSPATAIHRYPIGFTNETFLAWDLGDIPALSEQRVVKIIYRAWVRDADPFFPENKVERGQLVKNRAQLGTNRSDKREYEEFNPPGSGSFDDKVGPVQATTTVIEPDVSIAKEIEVGNGGFSAGPATAHSNDTLTYRLTVTNSGDAPAYDVEVTDQIDPALMEVEPEAQAGVTVTDNWTEADPDLAWRIDGPIPAEGGSVTLTYTAEFVAASQLHDGQQVPNTAKVPHYFGVPKATRDANPSHAYRDYEDGGEDSVEAVLDFPHLEIEKTTGLSGNPETGDAEIGQKFPWRIVVSNSSPTAGAKDVHVHDILPPNWKYDSGSTTLTPGGALEPSVTPISGREQLEWTIPAVGPEQSVVIAFSATPQTGAIDEPGTGSEANVNRANVITASDEAGNTENEEGAYEAGPDDATATLKVPQLTIAKTPDSGSAVAGDPSSFTIEVENTGSAPARNLDVEDVLPGGLSYTAGSATANPTAGFSEASVAAGPGAGETTVHWAIAELGAGQKVTITVPVTVGKDVPKETTLTNSANVTSDELPDPVEDEGSLIVGAEADMSIEKTGDATYTAGDEYTWHLRVRNLGPSDAQNVVVTDPLPAGTSFVSASSPCDEEAGEVSCDLGTAETGFDQTYDVTVKVDPSTEASPLSNTASVETETADPKEENDESTFGPDPSPLADVWVEKSVEPEAILRKHETTFTMVVGNDGPSTARDVELEDVLPAGLEFVSADEPPCSQASGTVSCSFGDMVPGAEATVHVTVKGTVNGEHDNKATVETTTPEPSGGKPNEDEATVIVGPVADLAIEKTAPATVAADGQLTWTLKVTNNGEDDATGVEVTDPLPAGVVFEAASAGCSLEGGAVVCDIGALANGESVEREITATVPRALADTTVVNTAKVEGDQGDDEPANDESSAETTVGPSADVAIVKTGPARVNANGVATWSLAVSNAGPSTATGVVVKDALPAGVELISATPTQGSCAGAVECQLGTLPKGGAAQIQVAAHVPPALEGSTLLNSAAVTAAEPDPVPDNNESKTTTIVDPPAPSDYDLAIVKTVDGSDQPGLGETVSYEIAVTNRGPATANAVKVIDTLPASLEYVKATIPGGKCAVKGSVITCAVPSLAAGAEVKARVTARVMQVGTIKNTATVSAAVADADPNNNRSTAKVRSTLEKTRLKVKKTRVGHGPVAAGERVRFKIRVTNLGKGVAADVVVCDRLPSTMSFAKLSGAKLQHGDACWEIDLLPGGASKTFRLVARVDGGVSGGAIRNVAYVKADNAPKRSGVAGVRVENTGPGRGGGVTG